MKVTRNQLETILTQKNTGLIIQGKPGVGKTTILKKLFKRTNTVEELVLAYQQGGHEKMIQLLKAQLEFQKGVVCIDDLGSEKNTINQWGTQVTPLVEAIRWLYEELAIRKTLDKESRLIVTTNYDLVDLSKKYGDRSIQRIIDHTAIIILEDTNLRKDNHIRHNNDLEDFINTLGKTGNALDNSFVEKLNQISQPNQTVKTKFLHEK